MWRKFLVIMKLLAVPLSLEQIRTNHFLIHRSVLLKSVQGKHCCIQFLYSDFVGQL